jgi:hypothetical protein
MSTIIKFLSEHGFTDLRIVTGRSSIADLLRSKRRCGLYVLLFADGRAYIGQSVDVVRRFAQHLKVHQDVEAISFKQVPRNQLDSAEQEAIRAAEQNGHKLRNVTFSAVAPVESDFDLIMSSEDQARWLSDLNWVDADGTRVLNPVLREKHSAKYRRLRVVPQSPVCYSSFR